MGAGVGVLAIGMAVLSLYTIYVSAKPQNRVSPILRLRAEGGFA